MMNRFRKGGREKKVGVIRRRKRGGIRKETEVEVETGVEETKVNIGISIEVGAGVEIKSIESKDIDDWYLLILISCILID